MEKTLRFFKFIDEWFADVAGHTMEDNQMVAGADEFLEAIDHELGGRGEVIMTFATGLDLSSGCPMLAKLIMRSHNQWGATYVLTGPIAEQYGAVGFELWICNVTHDVLGEHPKSIYILSVR